MEDEKMPICRLCLEIICDGRFEKIEAIIISLQNVLPDLDFTVSKQPVICNKCSETLQESFNFKSLCLDTEKYLQNRENTDGSPLYLVGNKMLNNEVKVEEIKKGKVCKFCLQVLEGELCTQLGTIEENILEKCLPELELIPTENPVICGACLEHLQNLFNFVTSCLDVEERIKHYRFVEGTNSHGQVDLHDILMLSVETQVDKNDHSSNAFKEIKEELMDSDDFNKIENMETGEVFIKDEDSKEITQEDNSSFSDEDSFTNNWSSVNTTESPHSYIDTNNKFKIEKLPHELDHDYIDVQPSHNKGVSKLSPVAKKFKKNYFTQQIEVQTLDVIEKTIQELEEKLKFYQKKYQVASKKLRDIHIFLQELREKSLLSDEAYEKIMTCD